MATPRCKTCSTPTRRCDKCDGDGQGLFLDCARCDGTGKLCPDHGDRWHR